ncbi:response regulator transcription factor [Vibrio sp. A11]|uniref:response regulator transcription factor n=1 Tax=Vibrio TaxID=662 RepID=UPI001481E6E8|nr:MULTISPECIES: response regulator transcription factor [Vibrio]MBC3616080.1 response regulator transcription factor [Vibrio metschnikovii]MBC5812092.1 response regulator transcription factor [Vibrio metschnikovii]NNN61047.1 response regulator transcription factor [Vibrio sp. A11]
MTNIILVDDHPIVLMAAKVILEKNNFTVVAEAKNGVEAIKKIKEYQPHIVVIDISIPLIDGISVIERCTAMGITTKFLVLTSQPNSHFVSLCMQAGAYGYLSKETGLEELVTAMKAIAAGYKFFPDCVTHLSTVQDQNDLSILSAREIVVFNYLVSGLSNNEIAEKMLISNKTVSTYKKRIMDKLNAKNIVDLISIAKRNNV